MSGATAEHIALGLPGPLPAGERILWHGKPDRRALARHLFRVRAVGLYFVLLALWPVVDTAMSGAGVLRIMASPLAIVPIAVPVIALLHVGAWLTARTTTYVVTERRVILLIGVAVTKMVNVPLRLITHAEVRDHGDGSRDVALSISPSAKLGWLALWPHGRLWRFADPSPMLRGLPAGEPVEAILTDALMAAAPGLRFGDGSEHPAPTRPVGRLRPHRV